MKLQESTVSILKSFSQLNGNLWVEPGNVLKSVNESQTVFSKATIEDTFETAFGIYDLQEFLGIVQLAGPLEGTDFIFSDKFVTIKNGSTRVKYWYASKKVLRYPEKDIKMPPTLATFELTGSNLQRLKRAATMFGHPAISFFSNKDNPGISAQAYDPEVQSSSMFEVEIVPPTEKHDNCPDEFNYIFSIGNIKYLSEATSVFNVNLAAKGAAKIAQFDSADHPVTYYCAVDSNSTISTAPTDQ